MKKQQQTISRSVSLTGVGVHSGLPVTMTCEPAGPDAGIIWHGPQGIKMCIGQVVPISAPHATVLQNETGALSTIEHVMAALWACEIDNIVITLTHPEAPIMDGSSHDFIELFLRAGVTQQEVPRKYLTVREKITLSDVDELGAGARSLMLEPGDGFHELQFLYHSDFSRHKLEKEDISCEMTPEYFRENFSRARTCGFLEQAEQLRAAGLARGASLENTIVAKSATGEFVNKPRYSNEFTRHKILDLIGDLYLLGYRFTGKISGSKTGHSLNRKIIEHYRAHPELWVLK